jgi:hypothetical protein
MELRTHASNLLEVEVIIDCIISLSLGFFIQLQFGAWDSSVHVVIALNCIAGISVPKPTEESTAVVVSTERFTW